MPSSGTAGESVKLPGSLTELNRSCPRESVSSRGAASGREAAATVAVSGSG